MSEEEKWYDQVIPPFNFGQIFNGVNYPNPPNHYLIDVPWNFVSCINDIPQGDLQNERMGTVATMKSIHMNLVVASTNPQAYGDDTEAGGEAFSRPGPVRLALVWIRNSKGAIPNANQIWNIPIGQKLPITCFRNLDYPKQFKILWDETFNLGSFVGYTSSDNGDSPNYETNPYHGENAVLMIQKHIHLKGQYKTVFTEGGGFGASRVQDGALWLAVCGMWSAFSIDFPPIVNFFPQPALSGQTRIKYSDCDY